MSKLTDIIVTLLIIALTVNFLFYPLTIEHGEIPSWIFYGRLFLTLLIVGMLFVIGMRALRKKRATIKTNLYLLVGFVGLASGIAGFSWLTNFLNEEISSLQAQYPKEKIITIMNSPDLSNKVKSDASISIAQMTYQRTGQKSFYRLPNGEQALYEPTDEDLKDRQKYTEVNYLLVWARNVYAYIHLLWAGVSVLCLILVYTPFSRINFTHRNTS